MIKKQGNKYNVYDSTGKKKLGSHPSRAKALAQLRAIEASKERRGKK
jgi:hypothetical protein